MLRADSLDEADFLLTATRGTAFITDVAFLDGTWRDALQMAGEMHPVLAPLIVADPVDLPFLANTSTFGCSCILLRPLDFSQVIGRIRVANQIACDRADWLAEAGGTPHRPDRPVMHLD
jgi:hypothetical protein